MDLTPDRGVVLDIGANLGIMTWHLLHHFAKARVWAFEPIPENNSVLRTVMGERYAERLQVFDCALGNSEGSIEMVMPSDNDVRFQGLSHVKHESMPVQSEGMTYEVPIKRLDDLTDDIEVSGVKLDVENFEYFVLAGGTEMLKRDRPVVYTELWENENRDKCLSHMKSLGYRTMVVDNGHLVEFDEQHYVGQNFFFIPARQEHAAKVSA